MLKRYGWNQKGCDLFQFNRLLADEAGVSKGVWALIFIQEICRVGHCLFGVWFTVVLQYVYVDAQLGPVRRGPRI